MKQKVISTMLLLSMGATLLAGCGTTAGNGKEGVAGDSNAEEERLSISIHGTTSLEQELRLFTRRLKKLLKMVQLHTSRMAQKFIG